MDTGIGTQGQHPPRGGTWGCLWRWRHDCPSILRLSLIGNALQSPGAAHVKPPASQSVVRRPMALTNLGAYKCRISGPTPDLLSANLHFSEIRRRFLPTLHLRSTRQSHALQLTLLHSTLPLPKESSKPYKIHASEPPDLS